MRCETFEVRQTFFEVGHRGQSIRGTTFHHDAQGRGPAVLMLHSFTGSRVESGFLYVQLGRSLAARGLTAVAFDFLHSGESDGSFDQMLVSGELDDTLVMARWLRAQRFVDRGRLAVLGFSLGGLLAACANARCGAFAHMVLVAPTTVENLCRILGPKEGASVGPHTLHPRFVDDLRGHDPLADIVKHPRPTLVVQGTKDTAVPPEVSQQYIEAMQDAGLPVTVEMVEGADHAFTKPLVRQTLLEVVVNWLAGQLIEP